MNTFKKRIDELGRIVIPKEIRNSIKLNNYDELVMFVENNQIILKKSVGIELYKEKFQHLLNLCKELFDFNIFIFSTDKLVTSNDDNIPSGNDINIKQFEKSKLNIYKEDIIVDSNLLGYIVFINNDSKDYKDKYKLIKNIIIDIIN